MFRIKQNFIYYSSFQTSKEVTMLREQDKHFLWSLFVAVGVIMVWKGLWEGLYEIPYLGDAWVALFIGLTMLTLSGIIFKEFDPLGNLDKSAKSMIKLITTHPDRKHFMLKYHDNHLKKDITFNASDIRGVEKDSIVLNVDGKKSKEVFIPAHRVNEIVHQGKTYWRL